MSELISGNRDNECDYAKKAVPIKQTSQCHDGTPFAQRRGQYLKVDIALSNEMLQELPPLVFYVVKTYEQGEDDLSKEVLSMIPTTWFAENSQTLFLYPPPNYCVAGKGPTNWASRTFDRHYYPNSSWLEYEAISIETTKGRDHKSVLKKYKKILKGVPADQITDSDIPLEKFRKRKRTIVDFSTPSSQNSFQHQCSQEKEVSCERDSAVHTTAILAEQNHQLNTECQEDPPLSDYESYNSMAANQPAGHISPQNTAVVGTFNHLLNGLDNLEENEAELRDLQARHNEIGTGHDGDTDLLQISLSSGVTILNRLGSTHEQLDFNCNNGLSNWSNSDYVEPLVVQHMPPDTHQPARDVTKYSVAHSYCNFGSQGLSPENSQHNATCCATVQSTLAKLSIDVARILSLLETNRDSVLSRSIPRMEIELHEAVIKSYDLQLPCDTVEKVVALDTLLENTDLSVSFVMKFFHEFKGLKTINSFAAIVYTSLVSKKTSEALQWKSIQRGEDCRQGIRHLLNLIAVIGALSNVSITTDGRQDSGLIKVSADGKEKEINCSIINVRPVPTIRWKLGDELIPSNHHQETLVKDENVYGKVNVTSRLRYTFLSEHYEKILSCQITDSRFTKEDPHESKVSLNVSFFPQPNNEITLYDFVLGQPGDIKINLTAHPRPSFVLWKIEKRAHLDIRSFSNSIRINKTDNYKIFEINELNKTLHEVHLKMDPVREEDLHRQYRLVLIWRDLNVTREIPVKISTTSSKNNDQTIAVVFVIAALLIALVIYAHKTGRLCFADYNVVNKREEFQFGNGQESKKEYEDLIYAELDFNTPEKNGTVSTSDEKR